MNKTNMNKELLKSLTQEQIEKAKACKSNEELLALAKAEGIELSEEQLAAVSGGFCSTDAPDCKKKCSNCGTSVEGKYLYRVIGEGLYYEFNCPTCGKTWKATYYE